MSSNVSVLRRLRLILGFLGATALPGLYIAMPFLMAGEWYSALLMLAFGLSITVPPVIVVVMPLYFWLSKTRRLSIYWAALAGGAAGAAFGLCAAIRRIWLFGSNKTAYEIWKEVILYEEPHLFLLIGIFCGLIGWLIAFGPRVAPRASRASEV